LDLALLQPSLNQLQHLGDAIDGILTPTGIGRDMKRKGGHPPVAFKIISQLEQA
jgi:hypothetical protein